MVGRTNVGGVEIDIRGDAGHFRREMQSTERTTDRTQRAVRGELRRTGSEMDRLNSKIGATRTSMLALASSAGLGLITGVGVLKNFGQAMSTLKAVTGATDAQMEALTAKARLLGSTTRFSGTQAAEGMIFLARAGFTADEALRSVEGTLKLAQAGGLDLGRAADIASNVLGGFNMNVSETGRVVDVLAKAANAANVTVNSLGEGLKFAAPVADSLGIKLEETIAIIGKLGDSGIAGGLGGRGFSSFAVAFEARRKDIEAIIGEYDIAAEGFNNVIARLRDANVETSRIVQIFGAANLDIYTILANASADAAKGTAILTKRLEEAGGTADTVATIMDDNLNGAILGSISAMQELVLAMGDAGGESALIGAFDSLASLMRTAAANADILGVAFVALAARGILPLAASTFTRAVPALIAARTQLTLVGVAATAASGATTLLTRSMALVGGPLTIAIAGAAAAYVALARSAKRAKRDLAETNEALKRADEVIRSTNEFLGREDPLGKIGASAETARDRVDNLASALGDVVTRLKEVFEANKLNQAFEVSKAAQDLRNEIAEIEEERQQSIGGLDTIYGPKRELTREQRLEAFDATERGQQQRRAQQRLAVLENQFEELGVSPQDIIDAFKNGTKEAVAETTKGAPSSVAAGSPDAEALKLAAEEALALREELERAFEIELARAEGNEAQVRLLEDQEEILRRTADYIEAGLEAADAEKIARAEVLAIREAEIRAIVKGVQEEKAAEAQRRRDAEEAERQRAKDTLGLDPKDDGFDRELLKSDIKYALEEAIRSGDVSGAIQDVFERRVSDALANAIDGLVDEFLKLFEGLDLGGGKGGGLFGGLVDFVFGGVRASGGNVKAGTSYLVGERGAERFVPLEDGTILPNMNGQFIRDASQAAGKMELNAPFIVQGNITEEVLPKVMELFDEYQRSLPRVIDARVQDQRARGAY